MNKRPKYGGRVKGTPNKITYDVRTQIHEGVDVPHLFELIEKVEEEDPAKAADLMIKLFPYITAKLKEIDFTGDVNVNQTDMSKYTKEEIKAMAKIYKDAAKR